MALLVSLYAGIKVVKGLVSEANQACGKLDQVSSSADDALALAEKVANFIHEICGKYDKAKPVIEGVLKLPLIPFKSFLYRLKGVIEGGCSHNDEFLAQLHSPQIKESKEEVVAIIKKACVVNNGIYSWVSKIPIP